MVERTCRPGDCLGLLGVDLGQDPVQYLALLLEHPPVVTEPGERLRHSTSVNGDLQEVTKRANKA